MLSDCVNEYFSTLTFASLQSTEQQQPCCPRQPQDPFLSAAPARAGKAHTIAHPPAELGPCRLQPAEGRRLPRLDGRRAGNLGVDALAADAAQRARGVAVRQPAELGEAKDEDRRQGGAVGEEAVPVEHLAPGVLLLRGQAGKLIRPPHGRSARGASSLAQHKGDGARGAFQAGGPLLMLLI